MSGPLIAQELIFSGNASDQNCVAYVPQSLAGQFVEMTFYIQFSTGAAAGKAQIETACSLEPFHDYAGTWAPVGSTIDFVTQTSQKYASVTGVFQWLRVRIDTAVTTGTMKVYLMAASHAP